MAFYTQVIGFQLAGMESGCAWLHTGDVSEAFLVLEEDPQAEPKPIRSTGLYHVAILLPDRRDLSHLLRRLKGAGWPLSGTADHGVSQAVYLSDPDGNGLEFAWDYPPEAWPTAGQEVAMTTEALSIQALLLPTQGQPLEPLLPKATCIGHLHLHVSDLENAFAFYEKTLGLKIRQSTFPGALFLAFGGYHHHLGLNTWAGILPPPEHACGLISWTVETPPASGGGRRVLLTCGPGSDLPTAS